PLAEPSPAQAAYPAARYLTAEGTGRTAADAKDAALSELARVFEARIESEAVDSVKAVYGEGKDQEDWLRQEIRTRLRVTSRVALEGVRTDTVWRSSKDGLYHAVAALDRDRAAAAWRARLEEVDATISGAISALAGRSRLARLLGLRRVRDLWMDRSVVASRLRV
ncbi:hypothetical protein G3N55_12670, partial [Dissulfurirhabdus thermomarina]